MRPGVRCLAPLVLALAATSCDDEDGGLPGDLVEARARWEARGPADYDLVLERVCFCGSEGRGPVRVEVRGGEVVSRRYVETGEPVAQPFEALFRDVDTLFEFLADAFRDGAHTVEVEFDPELGFPTRSFVDFRAEVADEEEGHRVIGLEIVRPERDVP